MTTRAEQPAPDYVPGHDLLAGKVVVVTAAAGAGIGAAVVRRVLEEGARHVVVSDTHERRLAEAKEELAGDVVGSGLLGPCRGHPLGSFGKPRTRSARMLRWISSLPP